MQHLTKFILIFLGLLLSVLVQAHEMNPARLSLEEGENGSYSGTWMFPVNAVGLPAEVSFTDCQEEQRNFPEVKGKYLVSSIQIKCDETLKGKEIAFKGLTRLTDALVSIKFQDQTTFEGLASINSPKFDIPEEVSLYPTNYFWLGIEHLLSGIDHMLFVFGLLFLVSGTVNLVKTITAFTIAHSITLVLAAQGLVQLRGDIVEAIIALSIVWVAVENCLYKETSKSRYWVVFAFGLLHGLGFAALLTQYGLPKENFISLLLAFNLGVEFGQLAVLLIAFVLIRIILKKDWYSNEIKIPASLIIAAVGLFWFIERVF